MSYCDLPICAKTAVACTSIAAWNALMRADPEFGRYALSGVGRSAFEIAFTVVDGRHMTVDGAVMEKYVVSAVPKCGVWMMN